MVVSSTPLQVGGGGCRGHDCMVVRFTIVGCHTLNKEPPINSSGSS